MSTRQKWLLWPVAALAAIVLLIGVLFDWNWLKGPLENLVSARLGREFQIAGDLDVDLSLHPRITLTDVRLANPPWASDEPMLVVPRAEAVIDLPALVKGEIRLPEVSLSGPSLRLETRPDGPPNWRFMRRPSLPPNIPEIGRLQIANASIDYLAHGSGRRVAASLTQVTGSTGGTNGKMALAANGTLAGERLDLQLSGPPAAQLETAARPYPVALSLRLGESDLAGDLTLELGKEVPGISATLHSDRVMTADLAKLTAAGAANAPHAQNGAGKRWFGFDQLPALRADITYAIGQLEGPDLHLQNVQLKAGLANRLPTLALSGNGTFKQEPVVLDVRAGPAGANQKEGTPYRVNAKIEAGQTKVTAQGGIDRPELLQGVHLDFQTTSGDATDLLRRLGLAAPELPQLKAAGKLSREGEVWQVDDGYLQVGDSEVAGRVRADFSGARPLIAANLESSRLRAADFLPRATAGFAANAPAIPSIKNGDINLKAMPPIDVDLKLKASYTELSEFRFDRLDVALQLRDRAAVIDASGEGHFRGQPLGFEVHAGTEDSLKNPDAAYPVDVALHSEKTTLLAKGNVARPLSLAGLDVDLRLDGPDLGKLGDLLKLPLPDTPPYKLTGKVTHEADKERWNLIALNGSVGDSDLAGDVSLELSGDRPTVVADLRSKRLDFDDLGVLLGAPADTSAGETASSEQRQRAAEAKAEERVLPAKEFDIPELRKIDARVKFAGESIRAAKLPLEHMTVDLTLDHGKMRFQPLRFALADGEVEALMTLAGRSLLDGDFDLTLRHINLDQLLSRFNIKIADSTMKKGAGILGGRAKLKARGRSVAELAASADGELAVIMDGGQINALIIEGLGLDLGEVLAVLLADENEKRQVMVPVDCFVGQFAVNNGVMNTRALVLKTPDSTITGSGQADLGNERLALELLAHPHDVSALTASTPVRVEGTFKHPKIDVVSKQLEEKSLAALALGVVLPIVGAILPFIETGEKDHGLSCPALIQNADRATEAGKDAGTSDQKK
jgi:AsmA family protein